MYSKLMLSKIEKKNFANFCEYLSENEIFCKTGRSDGAQIEPFQPQKMKIQYEQLFRVGERGEGGRGVGRYCVTSGPWNKCLCHQSARAILIEQSEIVQTTLQQETSNTKYSLGDKQQSLFFQINCTFMLVKIIIICHFWSCYLQESFNKLYIVQLISSLASKVTKYHSKVKNHFFKLSLNYHH